MVGLLKLKGTNILVSGGIDFYFGDIEFEGGILMNSKVENFLKLVQENPDLRIVPMVDCEIVADDTHSWWLGDWGRSEINEIYSGRDHVHFKDDDQEDVLCDMVGCSYAETKDGRDIYELSDEEWDALFNSIEWEKVIVVYITT